MAVISFSQSLDEVQVGGEDLAVVEVGNFNGWPILSLGEDDSPTQVLEPCGMVRLAWGSGTAHHPESEHLPCITGLLENSIQIVIGNLPWLGLQFPPAPPGVLDGRGNPGRQVLVRLTGPMERLPAHAWVRKDLIDFLWNDCDDWFLFLADHERGSENGKDQQKDQSMCFHVRRSLFRFPAPQSQSSRRIRIAESPSSGVSGKVQVDPDTSPILERLELEPGLILPAGRGRW